MRRFRSFLALALSASLLVVAPAAIAQEVASEKSAEAPLPTAPVFDEELAKRVGADDYGMRSYVLVILKTGPKRMPEGEARNAMFAGHFANMERLAKAGKLALAGPFSKDPDQWRGLFVFATDDVEEAKRLVATDPVIINGEMVAEYHRWYGSAATMLVTEWHERIARQSM